MAVFVIHSFWVIVPLLLIDKYGIASLPIGMIVGQCLGGTIYFVYLWKKIDFRLNGRVVSLLCFSSIALLLSVLCRDTSMILQIILMTGVIGVTISFLSKEERGKIYALIQGKIS